MQWVSNRSWSLPPGYFPCAVQILFPNSCPFCEKVMEKYAEEGVVIIDEAKRVEEKRKKKADLVKISISYEK